MTQGKFVFFEKFKRKKPAHTRAGFFKAGCLVFEESIRRQIPKTTNLLHHQLRLVVEMTPLRSRFLNSAIASIAGAYAHAILHRLDEYLAVSYLARIRRIANRRDDGIGVIVLRQDFDLDFREEINHVLAAAIQFGVSLLTAETFHFGDRHARHTGISQRFLHTFQLEWLNNRRD